MFATSATLLNQHHDSLRRHIGQCQRLGGVRMRLRSWVETVHGIVAPRMFTTVVLLSLGSAAALSVTGLGA